MRTDKIMTITEFAAKLGVTPSTVRRWELTGKITPMRTSGGHRRYYESDVRRIQKEAKSTMIQGMSGENPDGRVVIYCRISPEERRTSALKHQSLMLEMFARGRGYTPEIVFEVGESTDLMRPKFLQIIHDIIAGKISTILVAHSDRLARFGFEFIKHIADVCGCEIISFDNEELSSTEEISADLIRIIEPLSQRLPTPLVNLPEAK